MTFNPTHVPSAPQEYASKAAELAYAQLTRLNEFAKTCPPQEAYMFYAQAREIAVSNDINQILVRYAMLTEHITSADMNATIITPI